MRCDWHSPSQLRFVDFAARAIRLIYLGVLGDDRQFPTAYGRAAACRRSVGAPGARYAEDGAEKGSHSLSDADFGNFVKYLEGIHLRTTAP